MFYLFTCINNTDITVCDSDFYIFGLCFVLKTDLFLQSIHDEFLFYFESLVFLFICMSITSSQ